MANKLKIRRLLLSLVIICITSSAVSSEDTHHRIKEAVDLAREGEESALTGRPILLLVSRTGCPYCIQIKREVLEPMLLNRNYTDKIIILEIALDSSTTIFDFDKSTIEASDIGEKYGINITPTLLFLGPGGRELTERIVGINTIELFSYYVDQAIDDAVLKLHTK